MLEQLIDCSALPGRENCSLERNHEKDSCPHRRDNLSNRSYLFCWRANRLLISSPQRQPDGLVGQSLAQVLTLCSSRVHGLNSMNWKTGSCVVSHLLIFVASHLLFLFYSREKYKSRFLDTPWTYLVLCALAHVCSWSLLFLEVPYSVFCSASEQLVQTLRDLRIFPNDPLLLFFFCTKCTLSSRITDFLWTQVLSIQIF